MATQKITLTRALAKLKTLDSRIHAIKPQHLFAYKIGNQVSGTTLSADQFAKQSQSTWDELSDLVKLRSAIKTAIVAANSATQVTVCGEQMTIASAVERKMFYPTIKHVMVQICNNYGQLFKQVENHNVQVSQRLDKMLEGLVGKDKKMAEGEFEAVSRPFLEQNKADMLDPFSVYQKAQDKIKEVDAYLAEVDFVLSEANARTEIEIESSVLV